MALSCSVLNNDHDAHSTRDGVSRAGTAGSVVIAELER
jgi:hypothetical protein